MMIAKRMMMTILIIIIMVIARLRRSVNSLLWALTFKEKGKWEFEQVNLVMFMQVVKNTGASPFLHSYIQIHSQSFPLPFECLSQIRLDKANRRWYTYLNFLQKSPLDLTSHIFKSEVNVIYSYFGISLSCEISLYFRPLWTKWKLNSSQWTYN